MSQEQIVIAGVVALNVVLLILLVTAYRLLSAKAPAQTAEVTQAEHAAHAAQAAQIAQAAQYPLATQHPVTTPHPLAAQHPQSTRPVLSTEAQEIQTLEELFAHDSWPDDRFTRGGQLPARAVDGGRE